MKISLYLPEGSKDPKKFLESELTQASNIKDKKTRKAVVRGLVKLLSATTIHKEKVALFTDGTELLVEPYEGLERIYHCGKEYKIVKVDKKDFTWLLVVVDAQEAAIGESDGERINILWTDQSGIMRKHRAGGQSQRRFERGREEALKQWLRKISDILRSHDKPHMKIMVGGPGMTKDRFLKEMPSWLIDRVASVRSTGYTDENGLWEIMKMSRYV